MRKLYRSESDRKIVGIIGGIGEYYDVDTTLLRLGWLLFVICTGVIPGLVVYLIAAFIVPKHVARMAL